jgi:LemA protein
MAYFNFPAMIRNFIFLFFLTMMATVLSGCGVNNIPTYEENAKAKWSQVLNQYQRRSDLIPNLVKTVKGFAAHEKDVLVGVVNARAKATSLKLPSGVAPTAEQMQKLQAVQGELSSALSKLLLVVERYPDLKSSQNYLQLQTALEGTENRIGVARRDYIEAVRAYNTELKTIPGRWWKQALYPTSEPMPTFSIEKDKTTVPDVKFN